jgi:nucleotide-binding universal stress UspA family protein
MFRTILTPLDGSPFAEQALPYALSLARSSGASLDLVEVHILYALKDPTLGRYCYDPNLDVQCKQQEELYLEGTAKWLAAVAPVPITSAVVSGLEADGILERIGTGKADLVVMTTHGRGPLGRFFLGSVADELIRRAAVPVLLVRPGEPAPGLVPEPGLENVLIPLDGSTLAEQVLEAATDVIRLREGSGTLLRVLESRTRVPTSKGMPAGAPERDQEAEAWDYLEKIAERFRSEGLRVQTRVVAAPRAAEAILKEAEGHGLIALATHGRGGVRRMLLGSIADKVVRGAATPVLVYRPKA